MVDARLLDGSRLNAIIHPLALGGPLVSIRRFGARPLASEDLIAHQSITKEILRFLSACIEARINILIWVVRRQIASAINLVVQVARLVGGVRNIVKVSEITGMEGDILSMHDIFEFKQTGLDENRVAQGYFSATGIRPASLKKLDTCGLSLPTELFERRILKA